MEIPFYLRYKEFENAYYNNLERWFENHINTNEIDFLFYLKEMYKPYLSYNFSENKLQADASVEIKHHFFLHDKRLGNSVNPNIYQARNISTRINRITEVKSISMLEYAQSILDKIHQYFHKNQISMKEKETILNYINYYEIITAKDKKGYYLDYDIHQKMTPFLKAFLPHFGSTVHISLYKEFIFSVVKIADFIDSKLKDVNIFDETSYSELRSEAMITIHMRNQTFLTVCN